MSPYFDGCYFDPTYFDASVCGGVSQGSHYVKRPPMAPVREFPRHPEPGIGRRLEDDPDDLWLLGLEGDN